MSADIRKCDFRGCKVFGKYQNSKSKLQFDENTIPQDYIKRLEEFRVRDNVRLTSDIIYVDMQDRKKY